MGDKVRKKNMSKIEYISPEGLRIDGRRSGEIRKISCKLGYFPQCDGSAYYEQGNTKVVCSVFGPHEVRRRNQAAHDRAVLNCEYAVASFSRGERKQVSKGDRQSKEFSLILRQTFESVILTHLFPRSEIDIYVQVIQNDGGVTACALNAATLALIDAGIPLKDYVCACTAGYLENTPVVDLNFTERGARGAEVVLGVLPNSEKIVSIQMDSKMPLVHLEDVVTLARQGCLRIHQQLQQATLEHSAEVARPRGAIS
eukprot:TRINITY_DN5802_c0_g1_i1.p1 TRINITY_DN5802_c0_g1~~TRINITY_DN5802_c0_g1_i1.p1  ORF type:complete len:266 (+),score=39.68 TRINITY_DN5802_c0_g1_i1:33-800(+)